MNEREELINVAATRILLKAVVGVLFVGTLLVWAAILGGIVHG